MKAVLFDLYETLVTENHPEWHAPAPTPGERLGIAQEDFNREWSVRYQARMTGKLRQLQRRVEGDLRFVRDRAA